MLYEFPVQPVTGLLLRPDNGLDDATYPSEMLDEFPGQPVIRLLLRPDNGLDDAHQIIRSHVTDLRKNKNYRCLKK